MLFWIYLFVTTNQEESWNLVCIPYVSSGPSLLPNELLNLNFLFCFFFNYLIADQNSLLMYPVIGLFSPHLVQRHYLLPICLNAYSLNSLKCCHFPALNSKSTSLLTQCTPFGCLYPFLQIPCLSNSFTNSKSITPIQVSPRNTRFHIPDGTPFKSTTDRSTSSH